MAIVKGSGGLLSASASLLADYNFTLYLKVKDVAATGIYGRYIRYWFDSVQSYGIYIAVSDATVSGSAAFGYSVSATDAAGITPAVWKSLAVHGNSTDRFISLRTENGDTTNETVAGVPAEDTPLLQVLEGSLMPVGTKVDAIVICATELSEAQIASLDAGADPSTMPNIVEYWDGQTGVVDDGSGNLTSWTGANGTVLLPSGTMTVDDDHAAAGGDVVQPTISSAATSTDGDSITINFSETVNVGAGGNGGFVVNATYGQITLTPTTTLPAQNVVFTTNRKVENGESLAGVFTQPGDGFEDAAGNDLASGSFAITNASKIHRLYSDAGKTTAYTTAGVVVRLLNSDLTDAVAAQTLNPDASGYVQVAESLVAGTYAAAVVSADGSLLGIGEHVVA